MTHLGMRAWVGSGVASSGPWRTFDAEDLRRGLAWTGPNGHDRLETLPASPAPIAPPQQLVVSGLYRYVRNPMYVAVLSTILGQALIQGRPVLFGYAAVIALAFAAVVHWYEEPALTRQFGDAYRQYRANVPGWRPRRRPWNPPNP